MLKKIKDNALSKGLKTAINYKIKAFGEIHTLKIDSQQKAIEVTLHLEGEERPLQATINRYELKEEGGKHYLVAHDIVTSKIWLTTVANSYLHGRKFKIPAEYVKFLKVVV